MSEGIDPAHESTKNLITTNRLLWTGITVNNRKLTANISALVELAKKEEIQTEVISKLSKTIAITTGVTAIVTKKLGHNLVYLGDLLLKSFSAFTENFTIGISVIKLGLDDVGRALRTLIFALDEVGYVTSVLTQANKETQEVQRRFILTMVAGEKKGDLADKFKKEIAKEQKNAYTELRMLSLEILKPIKEAGKETGKEAKKGFKFNRAEKWLASFGKRQVIKAFQFGIGFVKQVISLATAPGMVAFSKTLEAIGKIINVILIPLKPFLFLLELIGKVIEAALSPMQVAIYEGLQPLIEDLVGIIPVLMEMVQGWIDDGLLDEIIFGIINTINGLITALVEGDLMKQIFDLSVEILRLATTLVTTGLILTLFSLTKAIMNLAMVLITPNADGQTLIEQLILITLAFTTFASTILTAFSPLINFILGLDVATLGRILYGVGIALAIMMGLSHGFPAGAFLAALYAGLWMAVASPLLSLQEGGVVPGQGPVPIMAHGGEQVWSADAQEEMIELLEENNRLQRQVLIMKEEKYR